MKLREAFRISGILGREVIYFMAKSTRPDLSPEKLSQIVRRSGLQYVALSFFMTLMVVTSSVLPVLFPSEDVPFPDALRISGITYSATIFTLAFMTSASASWIIQEYDLFRPLTHLPLRRRDIRLLALLTASRSSLALSVVPLIYGIVLALRFGSAPIALLAISYGYTSLLLALGASFVLASLVGRRRSGISFRAKVARAINTLIFVLCMTSIYLASQMLSIVGFLLGRIRGALGSFAGVLRFIYPFSVAEGLMMALEPGTPLAASLVALGYLGLAILVFDKGFMRYWAGMISPSYLRPEEVGEVELKPPGKLTMRPYLGVLIKDLKMAYRDPRTAYMLFTPALILLSLIPYLLEGGKHVGTLLGLTCGLSGLLLSVAAYQLIVAEGDRFWLLFANGIRRRDLCLAKALACTTAYATYSLLMGVVATLATGQLDCLIYVASSILLGLSTSLICTQLIVRGVGPETKMSKISLGDLLLFLSISALLASPYYLAIGLGEPLLAVICTGAETGISLLLLQLLDRARRSY